MYHYRAHVLRVYDGDTITVRVDLGFRTFTEQRLRLARINAWEVRGSERPAGLIARDWLRTRILNKPVLVETLKDRTGKFGRFIAEIKTLDGANVNDQLVNLGHAKYQEY